MDAKAYREQHGADVLVKAKPTITHMRKLNVPIDLISKVSGIDDSVVNRILSRKFIRKSTAQKIQAIDKTRINEFLSVTRKGFVPSGIAKELLTDLRVSGFSFRKLERETGVIMRLRHKKARASKVREIERVYRQLGVAA